ncbi:hypothetical protein P43SY_009074 [Pythium insidiosum]|uniref:Uncharacterized protein n=1 Tax=Pythium insidiosum TaxID=114742 RepID=A0AAD5QC46_PYTIN|nr:hypothetical protein P43SY_009074 [Pythium insidiosum]
MDAICEALDHELQAICFATGTGASPQPRSIGERCAVCRATTGVRAEWLVLRRYPVLVRWLLTRWHELTARQREEPRLGRAASLSQLCVVLDCCDLLVGPSASTAQLLASRVDFKLLCAVISSHREVAVAARAMLLASVVQQWRIDDEDASAVIADVLVAMQHELRDTVVQDVTQASTATRSKKRSRAATASGFTGNKANSAVCRDCDVSRNPAVLHAREDRRRRGLEMLLNSLTSALFPDLVGLTKVLTDSVLHSETSGARDALLKLIESVRPWILLDVVANQVKQALHPGLTSEAVTRGDVHRIANASWLLKASALRPALRLTDDLFPIDTAVAWFPVLLRAVGLRGGEKDEALTQLSEVVLSATEELLRHDSDNDLSSPWLGRAFALSALLSTSSCVAAHSRDLLCTSDRFDTLAICLNAVLERVAWNGNDERIYKHDHLLEVIDARDDSTAPMQWRVRRSGAACDETNGDRQEQRPESLMVWSTPSPALAAWFRRFERPSAPKPTILLLSFGAWLRGVTNDFCRQAICVTTQDSWGALLGDVIKSLYLSVEFGGDGRAVQGVWLDVWMALSPSQTQRLRSLAFLRSLFWELSDGDSSPRSRWRLIESCVERAASEASDQTNSFIIASSLDAVVTTLDLVQYAVVPWSFMDEQVLLQEVESVESSVATLFIGGGSQRHHLLPLVMPLLEVWIIGVLKLERQQRGSSTLTRERVRRSLLSEVAQDAPWMRVWQERLEGWKRRHRHLHPQSIDDICGELKSTKL